MDLLYKDFSVSCNNCNLDKICLPRGLSHQQVEKLAVVVKNNAILQRGEYVYRQGDSFKGIIAIKSGSAKLVSHDKRGNEHILSVLLPGELIGLDGMNQDLHSCSAIALEVMSYCHIPPSRFDELFQKIPGISHELIKHCSDSITDSQNQLINSKCTAEEKLALFLVNLSDRLKKRGFSANRFNIPLTRQEMGNHLGLTLETVSRMLKQLQTEGLINVQRKYVEIIDMEKLRHIFS